MQFLLENVGYKYRSRRLANLLSSDKAKKMETQTFTFSLKVIKQSLSFGYNRKILSWALIVDPVEMYLISKLEYLRYYAYYINVNDTIITEKEVVLRKTKTKRKYIRAQRMVYIHPVNKIYHTFVE